MSTIFTVKEQTILDIVTKICEGDYCANMNEIVSKTDYSLETVRAVLGTLTQKNRIHTESENRGNKTFDDIFAVTESGSVLSYGEES